MNPAPPVMRRVAMQFRIWNSEFGIPETHSEFRPFGDLAG
jgi:hypothetical protein